MSNAINNKKQFIHSLKGPERLSKEQLTDILKSRVISGARRALAQKYGISETRVGRIWNEYYGGGKLSDYKSGLKKPIPEDPAKVTGMSIRQVKTARGEYAVREPKFEKIDKNADAKKRAICARSVKVKPRDLNIDIESVDNMDDNEAEIIAGEIGAGNNSGELLAIVDRLIESNENLSEKTLRALKYVQKNSKQNYYSESEYSSDNIDDDDETDDSTAGYKKPHNVPKSDPIHEEDELEEYYEPDGNRNIRYSGHSINSGQRLCTATTTSNSAAPGMAVRQSGIQRVDGLLAKSTRRNEGPPRTNTRAQPVYYGYREDGVEHGPQQVNTNAPSRYESPLSSTEYNTGQRCVQPNNSCNNNQQYTQSQQSTGVYGQGGDRPSEAVQAFSWIKPRKI